MCIFEYSSGFGTLRKEFWLVNLLLMLVNQLVMVIRTRRLLLVNKLIIVKLGIHSLLVVNKLESLIITTLNWVWSLLKLLITFELRLINHLVKSVRLIVDDHWIAFSVFRLVARHIAQGADISSWISFLIMTICSRRCAEPSGGKESHWDGSTGRGGCCKS